MTTPTRRARAPAHPVARSAAVGPREANGYAHHMTRDPYATRPPHEVILKMAWGDHQVTNWATLVEARTIGAQLRAPALEPSRRMTTSSSASR